MSEKVKVNIVTGVRKTSKAGKDYFQYTDDKGVVYISQDEIKEGVGEYFKTSKESEFNGKKQTTYYLAKEEYKAKGKPNFTPKKPIDEALRLVAHWEDCKIVARPKTKEELDIEIKDALNRIKGYPA